MAAQSLLSKENPNLRKLTKSEKRLSTILLVALFATANFYGLSYLFDLMSSYSRDVSDLRNQEHSNEIWLREKDLWLNRQHWISATQPRILESVINIAKANQLEIQEQSFGEILSTPNYQAVTVRLKLSGALQNVIKWLVQIQQPELFQAVTSFSLKSANDPPTVSLELEIARWYAPKT
jgi:hypothetical protein